MKPTVVATRADGSTGVTPTEEDILAIIAPCEKGATNTPASFTRREDARAEHGDGPLVEDLAHCLSIMKKPVVGVRSAASTDGTYSALVKTGAGTATFTAGASKPLDAFNVVLDFPKGGTVEATGITYRTSLDGGVTKSAELALGTDESIVIPGTGITVELGAGTILAGTTVTFTTTAPASTNPDLIAALEGLRVSTLQWEGLLVRGDATSTTVSTLDLWLQDLEARGVFKFAIVCFRPKNAGETDAAYAAAFATAFGGVSSIRVFVCTDGGDLPSLIRGIKQFRASSVGIAARALSIPLGTDPAWVRLGPLPGYEIATDQGMPKYHDEELFPVLDDLRATSLRSMPDRQGVFPTNVRVLSPAGSSYVYLQHVRCMNRGLRLAFFILAGELSRGVAKNPKRGPGGQVYIAETAAQEIEQMVNIAIGKELDGQVDEFLFTLSRTDDLGSNEGAVLTGTLDIVALAYVKKFAFTSRFVRTITAQAA